MTTLTDQLAQIRGGQSNIDAGQALQDLTLTCVDLNKPGKLIVEISVKPQGRKSGAVAVSVRITPKPPTEAAEQELVFTMPSGRWTRDHPKQQTLDLQPVPAPAPQPTEKTA